MTAFTCSRNEAALRRPVQADRGVVYKYGVAKKHPRRVDRHLTKFAEAVSELPGFESGTPDVVCLKSGVWKNEAPVKILIPLGDLANEIKQRLPFAAAAKDLPRGRKRPGWKQAFRAALVAASRVDEYKAVLGRMRVRPALIGTIVNLLREEAEWVTSAGSIEAEPDPGDAPFWECAEHGRADFIVTLNPRDFPQSKVKAKVILPSEPLPSAATRRETSGGRPPRRRRR